jgi:hypothetical protein
MSEQKSFLQIIVQGTLILLFAGSFLILLGIFNGILGWDIFGPKVEQALYAVFWSCVALACSGIAVTAVLGIREIAESATAVAEKMTSFHRRRFSVRKILFGAGMILCVITLSIAGLSYTNARVEQHRTAVFKNSYGTGTRQCQTTGNIGKRTSKPFLYPQNISLCNLPR